MKIFSIDSKNALKHKKYLQKNRAPNYFIAPTKESERKHIKDKFRENIYIALPAAVITIAVFAVSSTGSDLPAVKAVEWLKVMPYIIVLLLAPAGMNVFIVLGIGIILAGSIGLGSMPQ